MIYIIKFLELYLKTFHNDCHYSIGVMIDGHRSVFNFGETRGSMLGTQMVFLKDSFTSLSDKERETAIDLSIDFLNGERK